MMNRSMAAGYACLALTLVVVGANHVRTRTKSLDALVAGSDLHAEPGRPRLLVVFHARDCAERVESLAVWNRVHDDGVARVVGLVSDQSLSPEALADIRAGAGLDYPIVSIAHRDLVGALASLNYHSTPVAVFVDEHGRVRHAVSLYEDDARSSRDDMMAYLHLADRRP